MRFRFKSLGVPAHQVNPDLMDYLTPQWTRRSFFGGDITFNKSLICKAYFISHKCPSYCNVTKPLNSVLMYPNVPNDIFI